MIALALFAQGCNFDFQPSIPAGLQASPFLPATKASTTQTVPIVSPDSTQAHPAPTLPCQDNLTFISDLTIPDGSKVKPDAILDKRWEVQNTGTCNWDERYTLRLIAGEPLGAKETQALYPARSGVSLVIRIEFLAPSQAGSYRSAWQAYNPAGEPFGDTIYIAVNVTE